MARGVNKVILVGYVGKDPEIRYSPNGAAIGNCSIATSDSWKDKNTGEKQERTEWHRLVFFSRLAEILGEYVKKGQLLYVEGRLQTRKWQDKEGIERYTTEIVVNEMQMLGSKNGQGSGDRSSDADEYARQSGRSSAARKPQTAPPDFDDDIPF